MSEFLYVLRRTSTEQKFGIQWRAWSLSDQGWYCQVYSIIDDGPAAAWNKRLLKQTAPECTDNQLREGDQIVNVNGKTTEEDIVLEMTTALFISMRIRRDYPATTPELHEHDRTPSIAPVTSSPEMDGHLPLTSSFMPSIAPVANSSTRRDRRDRLSKHVQISKTLTGVLRHRATRLRVSIRPDGYCPVSEVLALPQLIDMGCTVADVEEVVQNSDKHRFELKDENGVCYIRAVQGHSIKTVTDEDLLQPLRLDDPDLPTICVHGTYRRHWDSIMRHGLIAGGGLRRGSRNHVHFQPFEPGDRRTISGMRHDCEIAIWIDLKMAISDGVPFYTSANEVILSPGKVGKIDCKYFRKVMDLRSRALVYTSP